MDPGGVGSARQDEHRSSAGVLSALQHSCYGVPVLGWTRPVSPTGGSIGHKDSL